MALVLNNSDKESLTGDSKVDRTDNENIDPDADVESTKKKLRYPYQIFLIFGNELCERFSFYGMRAILTLYMTRILKFNQNDAISVSNASSMLAAFSPIIGGLISDTYLGKFKTILYFSAIYALGDILQSLTAIQSLNIPEIPFSMLGLGLTAIGSGGIKPCVSALGADQFILPQHAKHLASYFGIFYLTINIGSVIATIVTPELREHVECFGQETCYPLAFGVPAVLMLVSLVMFLVGKPWYRIVEPEGNILLEVFGTIKYALKRKWKSTEKKAHWLDHAQDKYSQREIDDIKTCLHLFVLYIPLPIFWAAYNYGGARWFFQSLRMDGTLSDSFTILPDQTGVINGILILLLVPVFDRVVYPFLARFNILKNPLHKLIAGGFVAGFAFLGSIILEVQLDKDNALVMGPGQSHLNLINMAPRTLNGVLIGPEKTFDFELEENLSFLPGLVPQGEFKLELNDTTSTFSFSLKEQEAKTILMTGMRNNELIHFVFPNGSNPESETNATDSLDKSMEGKAVIRLIQFGLWNDPGPPPYTEESPIVKDNLKTSVFLIESEEGFQFPSNSTAYSDWRSTPTQEVDPKKYTVVIKSEGNTDVDLGTIRLKQGGSYILAVVKDEDGSYHHAFSIITPYDSVHMLWLIPQNFLLTVAEILFAITLIEFSYTQAPKRLKSVMQAGWMMTTAVGALIVILVTQANFFDKVWKEYVMFAGVIFADMLLLAYLSRGFKPVAIDNGEMDKNDNKKVQTD